jgi:HNH endonuclease
MKKTCIWCKKNETEVTFLRAAHIFPKSLGGERICKNVCDVCNSYFGSKQSQSPSVEIALKEPLNISKTYLLSCKLPEKLAI